MYMYIKVDKGYRCYKFRLTKLCIEPHLALIILLVIK